MNMVIKDLEMYMVEVGGCMVLLFKGSEMKQIVQGGLKEIIVLMCDIMVNVINMKVIVSKVGFGM